MNANRNNANNNIITTRYIRPSHSVWHFSQTDVFPAKQHSTVFSTIVAWVVQQRELKLDKHRLKLLFMRRKSQLTPISMLAANLLIAWCYTHTMIWYTAHESATVSNVFTPLHREISDIGVSFESEYQLKCPPCFKGIANVDPHPSTSLVIIPCGLMGCSQSNILLFLLSWAFKRTLCWRWSFAAQGCSSDHFKLFLLVFAVWKSSFWLKSRAQNLAPKLHCLEVNRDRKRQRRQAWVGAFFQSQYTSFNPQ